MKEEIKYMVMAAAEYAQEQGNIGLCNLFNNELVCMHRDTPHVIVVDIHDFEERIMVTEREYDQYQAYMDIIHDQICTDVDDERDNWTPADDEYIIRGGFSEDVWDEGI